MLKSLKLFVIFSSILTFQSPAATFKLSEESLNQVALKGSPQIDQIEAAFYNAAVEEGEESQKYSPELFGQTSFSQTEERALILFQPVFTPIKQARLGVQKKFKSGFDTSAYVVTDQRSAQSAFIGKLRDITTTTLAFTVQMDLWKNIFGRLNKAELESAELEKKRAQIEKDIQLKAFKISLRRVYWSLVANNEATNISKELLKTAKSQLDESKLRLKNAVAEADEVARYEAQVASREGTLLYLQYQREIFIKQLRNLLPELAAHEIELEKYDLQKNITEVLACTATIAQQHKVPYEHTQYDESVALLRQIKSNNALINSRYADADVKFFGTLKSTGVGSDSINDRLTRGNYGDSLSDQLEQNRTGFEVGVNFILPLGKVKEGTQKVKELYDEKRLLNLINGTNVQVETTHLQLSKSILLLADVIRTQKVSSEQLSKRLKLMRKKYEQARVGVDEIVFDQDALLNSELNTIDTQLQILNTIFDYLVIFTETPCSFNRN
jgi:outer membrane protein TolC